MQDYGIFVAKALRYYSQELTIRMIEMIIFMPTKLISSLNIKVETRPPEKNM